MKVYSAEENKALCEKYPFLKIDDDYVSTKLDMMPEGWREAFGEQMCEEIRKQLEREDDKEFAVLEIKEKYGALRFYHTGSAEIDDIVDKYEAISERTCIICGKPATKISRGWICPYCDNCADRLNYRVEFRDIEEFYRDE